MLRLHFGNQEGVVWNFWEAVEEQEETGTQCQTSLSFHFQPPREQGICSLLFKEPFKSHVGQEAIQGSFDSFWFWPRKWNYWENPTFYKMLLLEGLSVGLILSHHCWATQSGEKRKLIFGWVCTDSISMSECGIRASQWVTFVILDVMMMC